MSSALLHSATRQRLASLPAARIAELARAATGKDELESVNWHFEPLPGGSGSAIGGTALYRIKIDSATSQTCSLILKVLHARQDEEPSSPYYWKREYEVYRSSLLERLPAHTFATPKIYCQQDFGDSCWLWLEDIDDSKDQWTLDEYRDIAARLGRLNGAWLSDAEPPAFDAEPPVFDAEPPVFDAEPPVFDAEPPVFDAEPPVFDAEPPVFDAEPPVFDAEPPVFDWLCHNWHSAIVPGLRDSFANLDQLLSSPLARAALPLEAKDEILAIWRDRHLFQAALAQLPRAFCHTDAFRRNILHRGDDVLLLDWALASVGAVGEELVCLVAVSLYYEGYSADYADQLDEAVFASYVTGLRQAGWKGDEKLARLGYTCGMALRGLAGVKQDLQLLRDRAGYKQLLRRHQMTSLDALARLYADVRRFRLLKMAREARRLLAS